MKRPIEKKVFFVILAYLFVTVSPNLAQESMSLKTDVEKQILIKELEKILVSISHLRESTPRSRDYILSFGEKLSTTLLRAALEDIGLRAKSFTGGEAGIVTAERDVVNSITRSIREKISSVKTDST